jgi:alkanesulfonate monooxygenase SsuD/methylene tetrahydromethanopterin reductase-like flavin-dependent oxidoreductase (luciferase family)
MEEVARHTLEMVQMADAGGFNIVWSAEHHALEMTIACMVGSPYEPCPTGDCCGRRTVLASDQACG